MTSKEKYKAMIEKMIAKEKLKTCGVDSSQIYQKCHAKRYEKTFEICVRHVPDRNSCVLDVGRSTFTCKLCSYYNSVYSIGFDLKLDDGGHREFSLMPNVSHIVFDLNQADKVDIWPNYPNTFDLIVFADAIEHIFMAPEYSLLMFSYLLKPNGHIIVTTPNAIAIENRVRMIIGHNPFERIRYYSQNPGHYREYTVNELKEIGENAGLSVKVCYATNFYYSVGRRKYIAPFRIVPQFNDSVVAIFKKEIKI